MGQKLLSMTFPPSALNDAVIVHEVTNEATGMSRLAYGTTSAESALGSHDDRPVARNTSRLD